MKKEKFKVEITLKKGQITDVSPLTGDLNVSGPVASLSQFPKKDKKEIMKSVQHGTQILSGQNSPGWVIIRTSRGYIRVWR
ncbi:MAG: hypothetical protein JRJ68_09505 [Deltaproteobacteria bacterium]|nr:hypothetical protein [Deltaproteobacteria bacterium]